jgi:hypothetical protein
VPCAFSCIALLRISTGFPAPGYPQSVTAGSFEKDGFIYTMRQQDINLVGNFPLIIYKFDVTVFNKVFAKKFYPDFPLP